MPPSIMDSSAPSSSSPVSSLLLPKLTPAVDDWFLSTNSDHILTHALTRELNSTSASASSSSSSSRPSLESPESRAFPQSKHSDGFLQLQAQVGSPVSSNSICKEMPESPLNINSSVSAMNSISMPTPSSTTESFITHKYQDLQGGFHQLGNMPNLKPREAATHSSITSLFSSHAPSIALSSQAAAGATVAKVSKRRARANKKSPIAVLSASTSNFRAMVQQLTGIPPSHAPSHFWGSPGLPFLKPQPTRLPFHGSTLDLPTLDTSASFLLGSKLAPCAQNFSFLQRASGQSCHQPFSGLLPGGVPQKAAEPAHFQEKSKSFLGSGYQPNMINYESLLSSSSSPPSPGLWGPVDSGNLSGNLTKRSLKQLKLVPNITGECDQAFTRQSLNSLESSLLFDDDLDSWLAFDGGALASHSPRLDLAKVVS